MSTSPDYRAYLNPQPALSEAEQKALIAKYEPRSIYVESRKESREHWIESHRPTSIALVPELFVMAKAAGRKEARFADLLGAKDDLHERGVYIVEASTGHQSNDKKQWQIMRDRARDMLGNAVKKGKVGKPALGYTDAELWAMYAVMQDRVHKNWPDRREAIRARGIKPPGRTWALTLLPLLIARLSGAIPPAPLPRKRAAYVYFIKGRRQGQNRPQYQTNKAQERTNHAHAA